MKKIKLIKNPRGILYFIAIVPWAFLYLLYDWDGANLSIVFLLFIIQFFSFLIWILWKI